MIGVVATARTRHLDRNAAALCCRRAAGDRLPFAFMPDHRFSTLTPLVPFLILVPIFVANLPAREELALRTTAISVIVRRSRQRRYWRSTLCERRVTNMVISTSYERLPR